MNKILKILLCLSCLHVALLMGCSSTPQSISEINSTSTEPKIGNQVGNKAINFKLIDLSGNTVSLDEFRGKPVILNFWATWCGPCRIEMPYLQQIYDDWKDKGLILLEIDIQQSAATVQQYLDDSNLNLPTLLDITGKTAVDYGITAIPTTYFIDRDGIIRQVVRGTFPNKASIESQLSRIIQ